MTRRVLHAFVCAMWLAGPSVVAAQPRGELLERTLAIVGGNAITLSDVQVAMALGLVDAPNLDRATERLVERALILREVERYAPPEPDARRLEERLADLRSKFDPGQLTAILEAGGFSEARLRAWIRDELRIATYLDQRFAADGPDRRQAMIADWVNDLRRRTTIVELWKR